MAGRFANALPQPALIAFDASGATLAPVNAMKPSEVNAFARMRDGGLMIGGRFAQVDGQPRFAAAKFSLDGVLDAQWNPAPADDNDFVVVAHLPDPPPATTSHDAVRRILRNGAVDASWVPDFDAAPISAGCTSSAAASTSEPGSCPSAASSVPALPPSRTT